MSAGYLDNFAQRMLQDALAEASAIYWRRRAEQFRRALPRPGDYLGRNTTPEQREARRQRIQAAIDACELAAQYGERYGISRAAQYDVTRALEEAA